jgi:hypothetical protein
MTKCRINFEDDLKNLLKKLKKEYGIIIDFREVSKDKQNCYEIALPKDFDKKYKKIQGNLRKILSKIREREGKKKEEGKEFPIQKIEITKIPPLEFRDSKEKRLPLKIRLKSMPIRYDDNEPAIIIGNQRVPLPPFKNEHYFCRAMFEHLPNESIDWSLIYEKMTGYYEAYYGKPLKTRANWRLVYDTMRSVNQRIKEIANTNDNLFTWQEKSVKRNY